jgi:hypothetical protein
MKITRLLFATIIAGLFTAGSGQFALGQTATGQAAVGQATASGKWIVTVRMPGHTVSEEWTIQQKGTAITGTAKGERGELPVSGTLEGGFFRVTVKDGDKQYKVRATVDGGAMDGSITLGVGDAHLWFAKRPAAR